MPPKQVPIVSTGGNIDPTRVRPGRRGLGHLSHLLERVCRGDPDAWFGNVFRRQESAWNTREKPDRVTAKLAALQFYQLAIPAPKPPAESYNNAAFQRGKALFDGEAKCATCHVPPLFTEPGHNQHTPSEIGIDSFQADCSPTHIYRTAPLAGLWTHQKGGFFHDGRFATLGGARCSPVAECRRRPHGNPGRP